MSMPRLTERRLGAVLCLHEIERIRGIQSVGFKFFCVSHELVKARRTGQQRKYRSRIHKSDFGLVKSVEPTEKRFTYSTRFGMIRGLQLDMHR